MVGIRMTCMKLERSVFIPTLLRYEAVLKEAYQQSDECKVAIKELSRLCEADGEWEVYELKGEADSEWKIRPMYFKPIAVKIPLDLLTRVAKSFDALIESIDCSNEPSERATLPLAGR